MKIALIGYGKMGKMVEQAVLNTGNQIVAKFSRELGMPHERQHDFADADAVIDFSVAEAVIPHLELCLALGKPIIIGTTGWEEHLQMAKEKVLKAGGSCLYSPNFSIGVCLFQKIIAYAASLFEPFDEYDVSGFEMHHSKKKDQPSGTAKILTQTLLEQMPRMSEFDFTSQRSGHFPGTHTLHFDSPVDTLTFTHAARSREGFAHGALKAAEWLLSRQGFFTMDDMLSSSLEDQS
jgi:4-hydroxy-tetrahydrodipicolinate reductase